MTVSRRQKEILDAVGRHNENLKTAHQSVRNPVSRNAVYVSNTLVFQDFMQLLGVMEEYFPVFERRFRFTPEAYSRLRSLARRVKGEKTGAREARGAQR